MVRLFQKISNRGDTIVEALLAILVVGTILGGAYVAANRYFKNIRQAHEYSIATKIAEGQIEQLKSLSSSDVSSLSQTILCVQNGQIKTSAADCTVTDGITYTISVSKSVTNNEYTFTVTITWDNIVGGASPSSAKLVYKLYI